MAEEAKTRGSRKGLWISLACVVVLLGAAAVSLLIYLRSASFADFVRRKVIAGLEDATGGRVELASFHWNLSQLSFEARDLTIDGLEPPGQMPYVHVERALVRLHIISLFERQVSLEQVDLERPVVHVIVYPDGTTNAPEPKIKSQTSAIEQLFDMAIARANLHDGTLILNERTLPLDFAANDVLAAMTYDTRAQRYDGRVQVGKADVKYQNLRDVAARADLQFSLWHNILQIKDLKLASQQTSLEVNGRLTDFHRPQVELTYSTTANLAQAGAIIRTPQLRGGTALLTGSASYSEAAGYASTGRIAICGLDYVDDGLALSKVSLNSNYSLADDRLALTRIAARLLGGQINGNAEIRNILPAAAPSPQREVITVDKSSRNRSAINSSGQPQGTAQLRVSGLSLNALARMISVRALPVDKLNAVGSVSGSVNVTWRQSLADAFSDLALDIAAPTQVADNQLPVSGNVHGRYSIRGDRIDLSTLDLSTPQMQMQATGMLSATSVALQVNANATSLAALQPMLSAMGNAPLPVELAGSAKFNGTVNGRLVAPQVAGHLEATNFTYLYAPTPRIAPAQKSSASGKSWFQKAAAPPPAPPVPAVKPRHIHVDQFSGEVQYAQSGIALHHAVVRDGDAQLNLDGSATLEKGELKEDSQFQVQAALHNADVTELQHALGVDYPISGKLNFTMQIAGTATDPHGQGQFSLSDGEAHGRPIHSLTAKLVFVNHAAQFREIRLQAARGTVAGSADYNFRSQEIKLDLSGRSIDLADIPEVQLRRLQIAGVAAFTVQGSGTLEQPVINGHLEIASLVLNGDRLGNLTADAVTHGRQLTLTARSRFPIATFSLDGQVDLQGDMRGNATLRFTSLDVNPFLPSQVRAEVTQSASLGGEMQLSGPLKKPELLRGSMSIRQFSVAIERIPVQSDGPVELTFADETVTVQRCALTSEDTRFTLTGTASFRGDRPLNLRANGSLNLKLGQTIDATLTSYGVANVNLAINGTAANPVLSGRVEVVHAGMSMIDLPVGLGDVNGTMVFNQDRMEVENLNGRMGGGHVKFGGFVTFGRTIGFNLSADGNDIRFRYAGISVTSDQTLQLNGTLANASLTGNITVTRFAQIPSSDLQFLLASATTPPSIPNPNSPLNNLHLEIRILSTPELTVQTSLAKLSGDVDLRLRGTAERPVLLGRINVAEGDIKLAGQKYHLDRGDVTFLDPVRIDPVLDVEATTRVRDYDITIGLHGTLERLNTTYRSDPPLSSDDIISLLAFGRTQTENAMGGAGGGGTGSPGFGENASGALLSSAINQATGNRISKLFGVSSIRINPSFGGPENDPNARLTLEQQVSSNITFTYVTDLARSAQEVIQFEYNINSEYTIQGLRDENGVVSFDLLIRKRKR